MMNQLRLPLRAVPALATKPFVRGAANADAVTRVFDAASWPGGALALVGAPGSGKSHLCALWSARAGAWPLDEAPGVAARSVDLPCLADDADRLLAGAHPDYEEALFHALNRAARGLSGPLLLTGRTPPADWPCRLPDLRSRLNALPVATLAEPDDAMLRDLLVGFFRDCSVRPSDELLTYLVRRIERSAAGAGAIVEALDNACRRGARLGRPLASELLHHPPEPDEDDAVDDG